MSRTQRIRMPALIGILLVVALVGFPIGAALADHTNGYSISLQTGSPVFDAGDNETTYTWVLNGPTGGGVSHVTINTCLLGTAVGTGGVTTPSYGPDNSTTPAFTGYKWETGSDLAVGSTFILTFTGEWGVDGVADWLIKKGPDGHQLFGTTGGPNCAPPATGTVIIEKRVTGDLSNTGDEFAFTDDLPGTVGSLSDTDGPQTHNTVPVGPYSVTENTPVPNGYTLTSVTCTEAQGGDNGSTGSVANGASIDLDANETVTCVFVNHKQSTQCQVDCSPPPPPPPPPPPAVGTLIVEKQTDPDGATQAFSFSGAALGTGGASLSDGQSTSRTVGPGTYTVSELQPDGWDLTSITCTDSSTGGLASTGDVASSTATYRVDANETVRCVFTNTEEPDDGTIVVTKRTLPDGAEDAFGFAGDLSGDLSDGESLSATVEPGTYTVAEGAADGWELTDISCTDSDATGLGSSSNLSERSATMNVDPGETVECVFTNTENEVLPRPPIVRTPEEPKVLPKAPEDAVLPFTGGDPASFLTTAGLLIAAGGALALGGRRRRRP